MNVRGLLRTGHWRRTNTGSDARRRAINGARSTGHTACGNAGCDTACTGTARLR